MALFQGKTALVVAPDFPYPPNHGGRVDIWGRLKALAKLGFEIDLLVTVRSEPDHADLEVVKALVRSVRIIPRIRNFWNALKLRPFQMQSRSNLASVKLSTSYDFVLLEGMYVLPILENSSLDGRLTVLKMHNDEAVYNLELVRSSKGAFLRVFHFLEYLRFRGENARLPKEVKVIFFSSDTECLGFKERFPSIDSEYLGGALADESISVRPRTSKRVLFSGSLFMANNREAVQWYLDEVHTRLFDIEGYEFAIVGRSDGVAPAWLAEIKSHPRIHLYENVPSMEPFYESAGVFVNPMRHGTSIKMKTIEALRNGVPVVSSTCGAMGDRFQDGRDLFIADDGISFSNDVRRLLSDKKLSDQIAENGRRFIRDNYDHAARLRALLMPRLKNL
jgi:glycosyltransferase involved in cell wall biosynthesis